ncbi:M4 family metallopeptidase [Kitasatospora purpeofusca]|uniref:M4 family metallopeptidase n=1 Tax=Kitasatospora purpeofusca TaxID=67352 RepID=UPI0035DBF5A7
MSRSVPLHRLVPLAVTTALLVTGTSVCAAPAVSAAPAAPAPSAVPAPSGAPVPPAAPLSSAADRSAALAAADRQGPDIARSLGLTGQERLVAKDVVRDADGTRHLRYERTYAGLPVLGGALVAHQGADGTLKGADRASTAPLAGLGTTPALDAASAQTSALDSRPDARIGRAPRLVVWAADGAPRLAWETVLAGTAADGGPSKPHVITDAADGTVLRTFEGVRTGTGHGVHVGQVTVGTTPSGPGYELRDGARGGGRTTDLGNRGSGNGSVFTRPTEDGWGDGTPANRESAAVDAHFGVGATWDYYQDTFGRAGIRGDGIGALSRVHYGSGYVNAFWDDACFCMTFGDGDGDTHPLTSIDVAGHEMTHGVTAVTADLVYSGESGALNEATSDILGSMVEFHADLPADVPDYLIGEKLDLFGDGRPLRRMDRPSADGESPDSWYRGIGRLDVHNSSGVANHFFYLLAEGSGAKDINGVHYDSPTRGGITVTGIGRDRAAAVWYRALTVHMTSTTDYAGARAATLQAAAELYGATGEAYDAVATAWAAVNVGAALPAAPAVTHPGDQVTAVGTPAELLVTAPAVAGAPTFSAEGLPAGLAIDAGTGRIAGTPTEPGSTTVTVTATSASGTAASTRFTWAVTDGTGPCPTARLLGNGDFESGTAAPWAATSGVLDADPNQAAHGGAWKAWLNGYGSSRTDTLTQTVTVPAGCRATLGYWLHVDSAEDTDKVIFDRLTVTANGTQLATHSNLDRADGYTRRTVDLSAHAGQTVTLTFKGTEDFSIRTSFVLDDLAVEIGA